MNLKDVKKELNHVVYYDTGQLNIDGSSLRDFILSACILRRDKKNIFIIRLNCKIQSVKGR